jgi:hypothetical protein
MRKPTTRKTKALTKRKAGGKPRKNEKEYPNQSERGKCELQINKKGELYCRQKDGCRGECVLYSIPQGKPKADWRPEKQPKKPDSKRYYFCRCLEL